MILSNDLINTVRIDREKLINNFVTIIIYFDTIEIKCNYYCYLCELADRVPAMIEIQSMPFYIESLFQFNISVLTTLKELNAA